MYGIASPDYNKAWQSANKFYEQKEYDSAAYYYEQLAAKQPEDAIVYYNLGNTYYRLNQIGPAVLNYERALRADPSNKEAKDNLILTQSRINNRIQSAPDIFFVQWWKALTHATNANMWAMVSLVTFLLLIGAILARRFKKLQFPPQVTVGIVFIYIVTLILAYFAAQNKKFSGYAVVMVADAPFTTGATDNKPVSLVPEGTKVKWKAGKAGEVMVTLPDGRSGWMRRKTLTII
jgi:tetratricopeptide (TPR) repeat protein